MHLNGPSNSFMNIERVYTQRLKLIIVCISHWCNSLATPLEEITKTCHCICFNKQTKALELSMILIKPPAR